MGYDPLSVGSGLMDDADLIVRDAVFRNDPDYNNGQTYFLELTWLEPGEDETTERFGCGKNWETTDGRYANREDGKEQPFHKNSKLGELFSGLLAVMKSDSKANTAIRERVKEYPMGARDAEFWKGLMFHVHREDRHSKDAALGDWEVLVIDGFNGIEGAEGGAKKAAAPAKKAAKKAPAAKKEPEESGAEQGGGIDPKIREALDTIADESPDHDAFMERAIAEVIEVSSDAAVKEAVMEDESVEGSIWADAIARYKATLEGDG